MTTVDKRASGLGHVAHEVFPVSFLSNKKVILDRDELDQATALGDELLRSTPSLVFDRIKPSSSAVLQERGYVSLASILVGLLSVPVVLAATFGPMALLILTIPFIVGWSTSGIVLTVAAIVLITLSMAVGFPLLALSGYLAYRWTTITNFMTARKSPLAGLSFSQKRAALRRLKAGQMVPLSADISSSEIKVRVFSFNEEAKELILFYNAVDESQEWRAAFDNHLAASVGPRASLQAAISRKRW